LNEFVIDVIYKFKKLDIREASILGQVGVDWRLDASNLSRTDQPLEVGEHSPVKWLE